MWDYPTATTGRNMEDIENPGDDGTDSPINVEPTPEGDEATPEGEAGATETEGQDDGAEAPPATGSGDFDKLLAKYGGDQEKLAKAYFEQANSSSRLHDRLKNIEEYIKGRDVKPVDEGALVAADPDVQELTKDIRETQTEIQGFEKQQNQLIAEYGKLEREIAKISGKLESATFEDKPEVQRALDRAEAQQKRIHDDIKDTQREIKALTNTLKTQARQYKEAEVRAKDKVERQRLEDLRRREEAQEARGEFVDAMRTEATRYGIALESRQYAVLLQSINDRIYAYLSRLPEGAPGVDIPGAVGALVKEYADVMGLKAKFQTTSAARRAAAGTQTTTTPSKAPTAAPPKDGRWTADFVKERAKRLLG